MKKAQLIVDGSERSADLLYGTGFMAADPFIYFHDGEQAGILVSALEHDRAKQQVKPGVEVYESTVFSASRHPADQILALAAARGIRHFETPGDFPLQLADRLRQDGLTVTPVAGGFFPERLYKSSAEVMEITLAQQAGEAGYRRARAIIAAAEIGRDDMLYWEGEPLTSERLRTAIDLEQVKRGALPGGTIVAGGRQGAEPHNRGNGVLYAHAPIVMDIFPRLQSTGYWGDLTRTLVKGSASGRVRAAFAAVLDARESAKAALKAGAVPSEIHALAAEILEKAGFPTWKRPDGRNCGFFHGLGHGVGLEIHEAPRLSPVNSVPLAGGEVVTVEPGVYDPEWGGMRLEDLVQVRENGCDCLTTVSTELEIE